MANRSRFPYPSPGHLQDWAYCLQDLSKAADAYERALAGRHVDAADNEEGAHLLAILAWRAVALFEGGYDDTLPFLEETQVANWPRSVELFDTLKAARDAVLAFADAMGWSWEELASDYQTLLYLERDGDRHLFAWWGPKQRGHLAVSPTMRRLQLLGPYDDHVGERELSAATRYGSNVPHELRGPNGLPLPDSDPRFEGGDSLQKVITFDAEYVWPRLTDIYGEWDGLDALEEGEDPDFRSEFASLLWHYAHQLEFHLDDVTTVFVEDTVADPESDPIRVDGIGQPVAYLRRFKIPVGDLPHSYDGSWTPSLPYPESVYAGDPGQRILDIELRTRTRLRPGANPRWFLDAYRRYEENRPPELSFFQFCSQTHAHWIKPLEIPDLPSSNGSPADRPATPIEPEQEAATASVAEATGDTAEARRGKVKPPSKKCLQVYRLRVATGITNQTELAALMTSKGVPMTQGTVSRALTNVEKHLEDGNILPPIPSKPLTSKPASMDPNILEMGERQDGRTPRQRGQRDPDSEDG